MPRKHCTAEERGGQQKKSASRGVEKEIACHGG